MSTSFHVGQAIADEMRQQGRGCSWMAQQLHCDRTNVYKILNRSTIDTELLMRVSNVLNHDFFADLSKRVSTNRQQ